MNQIPKLMEVAQYTAKQDGTTASFYDTCSYLKPVLSLPAVWSLNYSLKLPLP